jgi:hypothetical protein
MQALMAALREAFGLGLTLASRTAEVYLRAFVLTALAVLATTALWAATVWIGSAPLTAFMTVLLAFVATGHVLFGLPLFSTAFFLAQFESVAGVFRLLGTLVYGGLLAVLIVGPLPPEVVAPATLVYWTLGCFVAAATLWIGLGGRWHVARNLTLLLILALRVASPQVLESLVRGISTGDALAAAPQPVTLGLDDIDRVVWFVKGVDGKPTPLFHYSTDGKGSVRLFDRPGLDPQTGAPLRPAGADTREAYRSQLQREAEHTAARRPAAPEASALTLSLDARQGTAWVPVQLGAGTYVIQAGGRVCWLENGACFDPTGEASDDRVEEALADLPRPVPSWRPLALLARNQKGSLFLIGAGATLTLEQPDSLAFLLNVERAPGSLTDSLTVDIAHR